MSTGAYLAGFIAAEGHFAHNLATGTFRFAVALGATDRGTCDLLADFFGVGRVYEFPRRRAHYDDEVVYAVRRLRDLVEVVVPFCDVHLPPSHKRDQYGAWRADLLDHWERKARRVRPYEVDGCAAARRAKGLCRHHYYLAHGR